MKQLLILVLFFLLPIFIFAEDLEENNECRKFYKLKLQDNKYFRYKPKQIILMKKLLKVHGILTVKIVKCFLLVVYLKENIL